MRKWFAEHVTRDMVRPIIYKACSRLMYMLTIALLWDRFINRSPVGLSTMFLLIFVGFVAAAWVALLRLDGYRLPKLPAKLVPRKKDPEIMYGDMIDHVDEPIVNFEDLEDDEQDGCLVVADAVCAVIFLAASFLV